MWVCVHVCVYACVCVHKLSVCMSICRVCPSPPTPHNTHTPLTPFTFTEHAHNQRTRAKNKTKTTNKERERGQNRKDPHTLQTCIWMRKCVRSVHASTKLFQQALLVVTNILGFNHRRLSKFYLTNNEMCSLPFQCRLSCFVVNIFTHTASTYFQHTNRSITKLLFI